MNKPPISFLGKVYRTLYTAHNMGNTISDLGLGLIISKKPALGISLSVLSGVFDTINLNLDSSENLDLVFQGWASVQNSYAREIFLGEMSNPHSKMKIFNSDWDFYLLEENHWFAHSESWNVFFCYPSFEGLFEKLLSNKSNYLRITSGRRATISSSSTTKISMNKETYSLEEDIKKPLIQSLLSEEVFSEIKKFNEKEIPRTYLFTGPPGTGKSSHIQLIAQNFGKWIRVDSEIAADNRFWEFINHLPLGEYVLIIDDVDHHDLSCTLLNLESIKNKFPVILLSSNSTSLLRGASLRPGRIDKIFEVIYPEEALVKALSPNIPSHYHERLKKLYAAYIKEIDDRCQVLGTDHVEEWIKEMYKRTKIVGDGWEKEE